MMDLVRPPSTSFSRAIQELLTLIEAEWPASDQGFVDCYVTARAAFDLYTGGTNPHLCSVEFAPRVLFRRRTSIAYNDAHGKRTWLYLWSDGGLGDVQHPDWRMDALPWLQLGALRRLTVLVISPLDLALSLLTASGEAYRADILRLAEARRIHPDDLDHRCRDALVHHVGNKRVFEERLSRVVEDLRAAYG